LLASTPSPPMCIPCAALLMIVPLSNSTLLPYTTLFRSRRSCHRRRFRADLRPAHPNQRPVGCQLMTTQTPLTVPPRPTNKWRTLGIIAAAAGFTVLTCIPAIGGVEVDIAGMIAHWQNGAEKMGQLLRPDFTFLPRTISPMLETLAMAVAGAAFAALVSVPVTLWASRPSNPNAITRQIVRLVINVTRAIPDLVWATVLVAIVGVGA